MLKSVAIPSPLQEKREISVDGFVCLLDEERLWLERASSVRKRIETTCSAEDKKGSHAHEIDTAIPVVFMYQGGNGSGAFLLKIFETCPAVWGEVGKIFFFVFDIVTQVEELQLLGLRTKKIKLITGCGAVREGTYVYDFFSTFCSGSQFIWPVNFVCLALVNIFNSGTHSHAIDATIPVEFMCNINVVGLPRCVLFKSHATVRETKGRSYLFKYSLPLKQKNRKKSNSEFKINAKYPFS
jgi:hypothetical protein